MSNIKNFRKKFGYSQQKLAELLGGDITQSAISQWETGRCTPPQYRLSQLAELFGVNEVEIIGETTAEPGTAAPAEEATSLTESEACLLAYFRSVDSSGRRMILSVASLEYERRRNEIVG